MVGPPSFWDSPRHLASTAASSMAIPAPCAANGSMACAASPSNAVAPSVHWPPSGTVNNAHFRHSSTAPIIIRAGAGHGDDAKAFLISETSLGALQPGLFQVPGTTTTTLIWRAPEIGKGTRCAFGP